MECGVSDLGCQLLQFVLHETEFATGVLAKWVGENGYAGQLSKFLSEHGEKLIALAGVTFGIYRWWAYRESRLHRKLEAYLRENDRRLRDGQAYVLDAIRRPGPGHKFKMPLFAELPLQSVLRERNWDRTAVATNVFDSADWQISKAMDKIDRRIEIAEATISSLRQQMSTAHVIRGAIASAQEGAKSDNATTRALTSFRTALQIPGQQENLVLRELEAHQLFKLGRWQNALESYKELEVRAGTQNDYRSQRMLKAKAMAYQAMAMQMQASELLPDATRSFNGCMNAFNKIKANAPYPTTLTIRHNFAPFYDWELLEQANYHFLSSFLAHNLGFVAVCQTQLDEALDAYQTIIDAPLSALPRSARKRLKQKAQEGLDRVNAASQEPRVFQTDFLP